MAIEYPSVGDLVLDGQYRLEECIGQGGMGHVFRAVHLEIGREVAIKYLRGVHIDNPRIVQRFQQEARLAGSIGHDNICEVTDLGADSAGNHYLIMPLLVGSSLDKFLKTESKLGLSRVIDLMCQTLSALSAAHENHIIHRDLKPRNVFVTQVGDRKDFVKLLDFGVSKVLSDKAVSELTDTGITLGTPYYMAPELAQGTKEIDYRVDLYAAGVILYEALTGSRPFEGDTYNEVMFRVVTEQARRPRAINPHIPPEVEAVIVKGIARKRDARFETASEMRSALLKCPSEFLTADEGKSISLSTMSVKAIQAFSSHAAKLQDLGAAKSRIRRWAAASLLAILVLGSGLFLWPEDPPVRESPPNPQTESKPAIVPAKSFLEMEEPRIAPAEDAKTLSIERTSNPPRMRTSSDVPNVSSTRGSLRSTSKKKRNKKTEPVPMKEPAAKDPPIVDGRMGTKIVTEF